MKYIKGLLIAILAFTMVACSSTTNDNTKENNEEAIKVLTPMGAPSLAMLGLYGNDKVIIDTVDGTDVLTAQLSKNDGEYDMIVAPINMGANLLSKGKSEYLLDSVVTWGNLYIVGSDERDVKSEGTFAAFGEKAVPQKVLMSSMDMKSIVPKIIYFNSANEVQAQLLAKKVSIGMLAEPAATATIAKAKEKGIKLKILKDLQKEYKEKNNMDSLGYPQAAIFVKKGSEDKVAAYMSKAEKFANETAISDEGAITKAVAIATPEKLGIPNAQIASKTWTRQNIKFVKVNHAKKDIETFLKQFNITLSDDKYTK